METYPLIRKKHTLLGTLKGIFKMVKSRGVVSKRTPLIIPKSNDYKKVEVMTLYNSESHYLEERELPKSTEELIEIVKQHNITGKGGASYPMYKKLEFLNQVEQRERIFIINATECDPGMLHDQWIANNLHEKINKTIKLVKLLMNIDKVFLATKYEIDTNNWKDIEIVKMPNVYPIGAEKAVIRATLGIEPYTYKYPIELGILVQNIQTILTLHNVLFDIKNINQHFLTYKDFENDKSYVVTTGIGSKLSDITKESGIHIGGGIMQGRIADPNETVSSATNFIATGNIPSFKNSKCKKCKQCTSHCPLGLDVHLAAKSEMDRSEALKCVKCGSCSYICPSGIDLCSNIQNIIQ